jgi:hypothetical protein
MDDGIREVHGVRCRKAEFSTEKNVIVRETDDGLIRMMDSGAVDLTEWQARYLAAKLYRLARRIKRRREAEEWAKASIPSSLAA